MPSGEPSGVGRSARVSCCQGGIVDSGRHVTDPGAGGAPVISVVIACYEGGRTLSDQLDALVRQDLAEPFEVIVADNGSTDDSVAIARSYTGRLDLRIVDASEVKGPGHARNRGVAQARAGLIAFCDADDIVADDWLRHLLAALRTHDFVAGRVDVEALNSGRVRRTRAMAQTDGLQRSPTAGGLPHAGAGNMGVTREVFLSVGGFDEGLRCLQDSDLCWRIQLAGTPLTYHREALLYTRLRSTLRGMARQGYLYGRSYAHLESRYEGAGQPARDVPRRRMPGALRKLAVLVGALRRGGPGGLVWQVSWHLGRRDAGRTLAQDGPPPLRSSLTGDASGSPADQPLMAHTPPRPA